MRARSDSRLTKRPGHGGRDERELGHCGLVCCLCVNEGACGGARRGQLGLELLFWDERWFTLARERARLSLARERARG